jgi:hypothetical protein
MRVKTMDPSTMTIEDLVVKALRKERRDVLGQPQDTTVLSVVFHGVELLSWIDGQGRVVRQETPFGWIMEACTAEEAMGMRIAADDADDILGGMAVSISGTDRDLRDAASLRIRLDNITPERFILSSRRQQVEAASPTNVVLNLVAASWPAPGEVEELKPEARKAYLASTPFVQADDPGIRRRAADLTQGLTNEIDKARAIYTWVFRNVKKQITVSLPSAVDVLKNMEGDCNEHTYLFTALARAAGLPTQMRIGLFYKDGSFYYHAWPSVYVGAWVEMDPTVGQELVDAAHIGLQEGELSNQLHLLEVIGRLKAEVLEEPGSVEAAEK